MCDRQRTRYNAQNLTRNKHGATGTQYCDGRAATLQRTTCRPSARAGTRTRTHGVARNDSRTLMGTHGTALGTRQCAGHAAASGESTSCTNSLTSSGFILMCHGFIMPSLKLRSTPCEHPKHPARRRSAPLLRHVVARLCVPPQRLLCRMPQNIVVCASRRRCGRVPAQMWARPGADVGESRRRCGRVPAQMWASRGADVGESRRRCGRVAAKMWASPSADVG
jgi:hypothetical protein